MAPRRRYKRRGFGRRLRRKYNKGATGKRLFKFRAVVPIFTTAGGAISQFFSRNPTALPEFSTCGGLFDSAKVCAMKFHWLPSQPNGSSITTVYAPAYVLYDPDETAAPVATADAALQYENCKVFNLYRPFKYYRKLDRITQQSTAGVTLGGGWSDIVTMPSNGGLMLFAAGLDATEEYGQLVVSYYVAFKNRR